MDVKKQKNIKFPDSVPEAGWLLILELIVGYIMFFLFTHSIGFDFGKDSVLDSWPVFIPSAFLAFFTIRVFSIIYGRYKYFSELHARVDRDFEIYFEED